ncbi:MAG: MlaD family protein [Candidatus Methylomirabilales bacterium]
MGKKANPTVIGGFIVGAIVLVTAGLVVFGTGTFWATTIPWVSYFPDSVKGLKVGAPVTFRGVTIGQVTDIKARLDARETPITVRTPVYWELNQDSIELIGISDAEIKKMRKEGDAIPNLLIKRGLRAQLNLQSFVTGQKFIQLDFRPDTPIRLVGADPTVPEFPTVRGGMAKLTQSIEELPLSEIGDAALALLQDVDQLVTSPEVKKLISSTTATLKQYKKLGRHIDEQVLPAVQDVMRDSSKLVQNLESQVTPAARDALTDASKLMRGLDSEVTPAARDALKEAKATLAEAQSFIGEKSELRHRLDVMLAELTAAARSIRGLTAYLERHPEALIAGKQGAGGNQR